MTQHDLIIAGGHVVMPEEQRRVDVAIADGRISAIGNDLDGVRAIGATGRLVLHGGVDAHCHIGRRCSTDSFL